MRFLDSNVLAYAFYRNEHTIRCQSAIQQGGVVDTFNLIEAFFIIERETGNRLLAQKAIRGLLKSSIRIVQVDVNVVFEALKIVSRFRLSVFDTIHYASALATGCNVILSYDRDFDKLDIPRQEP